MARLLLAAPSPGGARQPPLSRRYWLRHTSRMLGLLVFLTCLGAGTIGGVFFAFSAFVMKALLQLPASHGVAAMQRINVAVLNALFLGVFIGTAVLSAACIVAAIVRLSAPGSVWILSAGVLYLVGTFLVTMKFNVPRNERLARLDKESPQAVEYWPVYVREWSIWNHVRTVAALASAACGAVAFVA
jgi:uncharacterized membrane protein